MCQAGNSTCRRLPPSRLASPRRASRRLRSRQRGYGHGGAHRQHRRHNARRARRIGHTTSWWSGESPENDRRPRHAPRWVRLEWHSVKRNVFSINGIHEMDPPLCGVAGARTRWLRIMVRDPSWVVCRVSMSGLSGLASGFQLLCRPSCLRVDRPVPRRLTIIFLANRYWTWAW